MLSARCVSNSQPMYSRMIQLHAATVYEQKSVYLYVTFGIVSVLIYLLRNNLRQTLNLRTRLRLE